MINITKLADSSKLGWRLVQEYVLNPIADDSNNEKRINRAQTKAGMWSKTETSKSRKRQPPYYTAKTTEDKCNNVKSVRCLTSGKRGHLVDTCQENSKSKTSVLIILVQSCINLIWLGKCAFQLICHKQYVIHMK